MSAQRQELLQRVVERAQADDAFRTALLADPAAAVGAELGIEVPEAVTLRVIEADADEVVLVLPAIDVVSDAELAAAAGGIEACGVFSQWVGVSLS
jgi:hypothetical protein